MSYTCGMSDYLRDKLFKHQFLGIPYSMPTTIGLALFNTDPTIMGTGTEVPNSNNYARYSLPPDSTHWEIVTDSIYKYVNNKLSITMNIPTGTGWGNITWVGIYDSTTYGSGNLLWFGPAMYVRTVLSGETYFIAPGNIRLRYA
jgi:hypothetical protein